MSGGAQSRLVHWKSKLIDLSRRNRLLHFRPTRVSTVQIVGERPAEIFRTLYVKELPMRFLPRPDAAPAEPGPLPADLETAADWANSGVEFVPYDPEELQEAHKDTLLQTALDERQLDRSLLRIYQQSHAAQEDQGYNILYLALGFLEWYAPEEPQVPLRAPILLMPVELQRRTVRAPFVLHPLPEDPILNPALVQKLQGEFGIAVPPLPEDLDAFDPQDLFSLLAAATRDRAGWRVLTDIYLGLFSFAKFVMFKDLEAYAATFAGHPVIGALGGDPSGLGPAPAGVPGAAELDRALKPSAVFQVLDADSSQQEAIVAARHGSHLVLEGPPGTGKSQTITNLIAECLVAGKSVLFVSEKRAALEVVYNRLQQSGLGDFCLELHSRKANKRALAAELGRVLEMHLLPDHDEDAQLDRLEGVRSQLNEYVRELHSPFGALGYTPYRALGIVSALRGEAEVPVLFPALDQWTGDDLAAAGEAVAAVARALSVVGPVAEHPWRGARVEAAPYQVQMEVQVALGAVCPALREIRELAGPLGAATGQPAAGTLSGVDQMLDLCGLLQSTPGPTAEQVRDPMWNTMGADAERLLLDGETAAAHSAHLESRFLPAVLETDLEAMLERHRAHGQSFLRFLRPSWWRDRGTIRQLSRAGYRPGWAELEADLARAVAARRLRQAVSGAGARGRRLFADRWRGVDSDWADLRRVAAWLIRLRRHVQEGRAGERSLELAVSGQVPPAAASAAARTAEVLGSLRQGWAQLRGTVQLDEAVWAGGVPLDGLSLEDLSTRLEALADNLPELEAWARYQGARAEAEARRVGEFVGTALAQGVAPDRLVPAFTRQFLRLWLDGVFAERSTLRRLDRATHDELVQEFARLDRLLATLARIRARHLLSRKLPDASWQASEQSELGILQREVRRKRGHMAPRQLLARIPAVLRALKPCLLMSPLSVAQFLDPAIHQMDLVVFDEASQIPPEDAVGAIARGRQLIMVGDPKQLPPTPFFQVDLLAADGDPDAVETVPDAESILDECAIVFPPTYKKRLRWHYRSRHESLIAFSNQHFYEGDLLTFPSAAGGEHFGVSFVHLPDAVYDRGGRGDNREEARRVAQEVFRHFRGHPQLSLGVGTFSLRQQVAVQDAVEELRRQAPSLEEYFLTDRPEPFFIKNLESIQGDERDVIFLSVGYGRDGQGKVSMNFGPLNKDGGWRRLNVLVTRARTRLVIFSSITGDDIASDNIGVQRLKQYLDYAQKGTRILDDPAVAGRAPEAPLEQAVADALAERGIWAERQVGCSDYKLDLAVPDPDRPGRYLLGIECDGAGYQASATARDRDRLRRQVLEGLGWQIHRVWSPDWYRNPKRELDLILIALDAARAAAGAEAGPAPGSPAAPDPAPSAVAAAAEPPIVRMKEDEHGRAPATDADPVVRPYVRTPVRVVGPSDRFYDSGDQVAQVLARVVAIESPIHHLEAARRVAQHWEITRTGSQVLQRMAAAARDCAAAGLIRMRGDFYWAPDMQVPPVRNRAAEDAVREPELIPLEEIAAAAELVLAKEFCLQQDALVAQVGRLLGFPRSGARLEQQFAAGVAELIRSGRARSDERGIQLGP